jgi:rhamnulokinase
MANTKKTYLGFDLGASSGRAILGFINKNKLEIEEVHRFSNEHFELNGTLYWNFLALWKNIVHSLRVCSKKGYKKLDGIGIDTWGVDFGILGKDGKFVREPLCHRDSGTVGMDKVINSKIHQRDFYNITGFTISRIGSLAQLIAMQQEAGDDRLKIAKSFLMMPDLFRCFLSGNISVEKTIAATTLFLDIKTGKWSDALLRKFKIPERIMPDIVEPGTVTGKLKTDLAKRYKLNQAPIIAIAEHDTASAFATIPHADEDTIVISCGTWSVVGLSLDKPILTAKAFKAGFLNEMGFQSILFVQNLMGLYLFENVKRELESGGQKISYSKMVSMARKAGPFKNYLDTNAAMLFAAKEPLGLIKEYLKKTGQKSANTESIIRLLLEGLALSYKSSIEKLKKVTGRDYKRICMVGGGIKNTLLCQMAADATGLKVIAGPAEATITGNFAVQAFATKQLKTQKQIRELVRNSFSLKTYKPKETALWDKKYLNYKLTVKKSTKLK